MKISELKNNKVVRWICCVIVCYLLASWGVNGTVNPLNYWEQGVSGIISTESSEEYLMINLGDHPQEGHYINLDVAEMNSFVISIEIVTGDSDNGKHKKTMNLNKGMNSWAIDKLNLEEGWIKIPMKALEKEQVQIEQIYWSENKQVDALAMIKVFFSFICLSVFRSFVSWIKERYS